MCRNIGKSMALKCDCGDLSGLLRELLATGEPVGDGLWTPIAGTWLNVVIVPYGRSDQ